MTEPTSPDARVTTTTYDYRVQTDPTIKTWHLGAVQRGAASFCGVKLIEPDDTRAFALRVPADRRNYTTDPDVSKVTCRACKRSREYAKATAGAAAEPDKQLNKAERPSRRRKATGDPRADRAAADAGKQLSGSSVIEADPETGLPRIRPEYAAKAERVAAAQVAAARAARDAANADQA
jgi:hypothetical protein